MRLAPSQGLRFRADPVLRLYASVGMQERLRFVPFTTQWNLFDLDDPTHYDGAAKGETFPFPVSSS